MVPNRQPLLFYDTEHGTVNRYGGWPYQSHIQWPSTVWSFTAGSANMDWEQGPNASSKGLCADSSGPYAAAHAYSDKAFYSLGGSYDGDDVESPDTALSGLVVHDFAEGTWDNYSTASDSQPSRRTQAHAVFSPNFGLDGFLVVMGGAAPATAISGNNEGRSMVGMSAITLYDIANKTWFVQTATGDLPPIRAEFCAVGSPSADNKTFEVCVSSKSYPSCSAS